MGLDLYREEENICSSSYSGFNYFRILLGKEIGIELKKMDGFTGPENHHLGISWETVNDPISILLNHSDCDGEISPEDCAKCYPRILELVKNWEDDDFPMSWKGWAIKLANGMKKCAETNTELRFR